jgi:putative transposase
MVRPSQKKEVACWAVEEKQVSKRKACAWLGVHRSLVNYASIRKPDEELKDLLQRLSTTHRRWGFGLMFDWLRNNGYEWNHKKVYRVYTQMRLNLRIKPKKRIPTRNPIPLATPDAPNHCWSVDFMSDRLTDGRNFRAMTLIDDFNRESLDLEVDHSLPSERVVRVLDRVAQERGYPKKLRSDNGPEFIAQPLARWAETHGIQLAFIKPGKPMQNGYIERFNRTFREDVLDQYAFSHLDEVEAVGTKWRYTYNAERPHKALGGRTPWQYLAAHAESTRNLVALPPNPRDFAHEAHPNEGRKIQ